MFPSWTLFLSCILLYIQPYQHVHPFFILHIPQLGFPFLFKLQNKRLIQNPILIGIWSDKSTSSAAAVIDRWVPFPTHILLLIFLVLFVFCLFVLSFLSLATIQGRHLNIFTFSGSSLWEQGIVDKLKEILSQIWSASLEAEILLFDLSESSSSLFPLMSFLAWSKRLHKWISFVNLA